MFDTATLLTPALTSAPQAAQPGRSFDVDSLLTYQVNGPTDFLFQIHALHGMDQQVLNESLVITPPLPVHVYADPTVNHRFARVHADAGYYEFRYTARVLRTPEPANLAASEVAIAALPDEVLHNLMPTRYCESDHLSQAAQELFGGLPPGHARVSAICDWITRTSSTGSAALLPPPQRVTCSRSAPACAAISRTWASPSAAR